MMSSQTPKSLDLKLANIHANPTTARDFILADAKDADMAFGLSATGPSDEPGKTFRSLAEYRDLMREIVRQGLVDILMMSPSSSDLLSREERVFEGTTVTAAVRANDSADIHLVRGDRCSRTPSMHFLTATIDQLRGGRASCSPEDRRKGCNLGLYS